MKKIGIIGTLLLITLLLISSQAIKGEKKANQDVIQEDELVVEDWMTKPFIIDTVKNEDHV